MEEGRGRAMFPVPGGGYKGPEPSDRSGVGNSPSTGDFSSISLSDPRWSRSFCLDSNDLSSSLSLGHRFIKKSIRREGGVTG